MKYTYVGRNIPDVYCMHVTVVPVHHYLLLVQHPTRSRSTDYRVQPTEVFQDARVRESCVVESLAGLCDKNSSPYDRIVVKQWWDSTRSILF